MKTSPNNSRLLVFLAISMIILLSLHVPESSFAYTMSFSGQKNAKANTLSNIKSKPVHKISFVFSSDVGTVQSVSFRIYQLNVRNGVDESINLNSGNTAQITLSLPDGGYIAIAVSRIMTSSGPIHAEWEHVFTVHSKDQSFNINLRPIEGMA